MPSFDNQVHVPVAGGRKAPCGVCCRHYGHDCDLVEMETADHHRFLICNGPGCDGCGFVIGIELSDFEIRRLADIQLEGLRRAVS